MNLKFSQKPQNFPTKVINKLIKIPGCSVLFPDISDSDFRYIRTQSPFSYGLKPSTVAWHSLSSKNVLLRTSQRLKCSTFYYVQLYYFCVILSGNLSAFPYCPQLTPATPSWSVTLFRPVSCHNFYCFSLLLPAADPCNPFLVSDAVLAFVVGCVAVLAIGLVYRVVSAEEIQGKSNKDEVNIVT